MSLDNAGVRKAAVFVASLDPSAADALLNRLDPEQADLIRRVVMALDEVETDERQRVLDEFHRIGPMVPRECSAGIELDGPISRLPKRASSTSTPSADENHAFDGDVLSDDACAADAPPFDFLSDAEDQRLAQLLRGEPPPTVALVLSHLPPERAGEVLGCFAGRAGGGGPPDGRY